MKKIILFLLATHCYIIFSNQPRYVTLSDEAEIYHRSQNRTPHSSFNNVPYVNLNGQGPAIPVVNLNQPQGNPPQPIIIIPQGHPQSYQGSNKDIDDYQKQQLHSEIERLKSEAYTAKTQLLETQEILHKEQYGWKRFFQNSKWYFIGALTGFTFLITCVTYKGEYGIHHPLCSPLKK
ncbi:hypothetical protein KAZ82_00865 [Candidatus Babeliales bacterium]|nr:hypothetical protein [Candidatus Babeliales bacterium]